jgi:hypothetical protein
MPRGTVPDSRISSVVDTIQRDRVVRNKIHCFPAALPRWRLPNSVLTASGIWSRLRVTVSDLASRGIRL